MAIKMTEHTTGTSMVHVKAPPQPKVSKSNNPYTILGVKRNADLKKITAAYRKLAHALHPDRGGDLNTFRRVQGAYDILKDRVRRRQFDLDGFAAPHANDPTLEGAAQEMLASCFDSFFTTIEEQMAKPSQSPTQARISGLYLRLNDPVSILGMKFDQDIANFKNELAALRRVHKQLRKWKSSVRHPEGGGMYAMVYAGRVRRCVQALQSVHQNLHLARTAKRMLKSYTCHISKDKVHEQLEKLEQLAQSSTQVPSYAHTHGVIFKKGW